MDGLNELLASHLSLRRSQASSKNRDDCGEKMHSEESVVNVRS